MRYVFGFLGCFALGLMLSLGCSEGGGQGGSGGTGGSTGQVFPCTEQGIRDAIALGGGPHTFDCDGPTTVVIREALVIDKDVVLDGQGNLTVARDGIHTGFIVEEQATAGLRDLAVGEGLRGIENAGTLSLSGVTVSDCQAGGKFGLGAGILNHATATLTLSGSVVSNNDAGAGGGILNSGTAEILNSTLSGNTGGDLVNEGTMMLSNSTVYGSIWLSSPWTDPGSLTVAGSAVSGLCLCLEATTCQVTSDGYNIESSGDTCGFDQPTDQVDVTPEQLNLGPLQDNGGPTMTHALLTEPTPSVAIDAIPAEDCVDADGQPLTTDQRGEPRPAGAESKCDVGAFELQP